MIKPVHAVGFGIGIVERASGSGLSALAIKGPVAAHHGLRPPRISADLDVLVEPGRAQDLVNALARCGWSPRPMTRAAGIASAHSESLTHPDWPIDIDVHFRFPGFLEGDQRAFDALWEDRTTMTFAGVECTVAGRNGSIIIAMLHAIRPDASGGQRLHELELALDAVRAMDPAERQRLVDLVIASGAAAALASPLREAGVEVPVPTEVDATAWNARVASAGSFTGQVVSAAGGASGAERWKVLWLALWPSSEELRAAYEGEGREVGSMARLRIERLGRGLRALPGALRAYRDARRESRGLQ